jgi:hypothetical protein
VKLDRKTVRILNANSVNVDEYIKADSASLFEMVWELTHDLWSFTSNSDPNSPMKRNVVKIIKRK